MFGNNVGRIFDVFLARNIPSDHETFLTFVNGRFHVGSTKPVPYRLLDDASWTARVANTQVPLRGVVNSPAGPVYYLAVPLVPQCSASGEQPLGCSWWRSSTTSWRPTSMTLCAFPDS
jgi:hypothetical protein